jgi:hypothetical protein
MGIYQGFRLSLEQMLVNMGTDEHVENMDRVACGLSNQRSVGYRTARMAMCLIP